MYLMILTDVWKSKEDKIVMWHRFLFKWACFVALVYLLTAPLELDSSLAFMRSDIFFFRMT